VARHQTVQLTSLRTPPLKEQVIHELERLIKDGALQPGDRIPTERELSDQLAVSRSTVREAVQFLQALGVLEIRHGSGTFVAASASRSQDLRREWRRWTRNHAGRVRELLEVRQGIESFAAELAASRVAGGAVDPAAIESMAGALEDMEASGDTDVPDLVRADMLFHRSLCEASGNAALVEFAEVLGQELIRERAASFDLEGRPKRSHIQHREIYEAVAGGDSVRARAAVLDHLRSVELDIARSLLAGDAAETQEKGEIT
jgi:GntR family transcriptional repressor for pyruvate dehydrogenase complex